ncbi:ubiquitin carboxyl-terminal hydrolase 28-like [Sturnira hondurensis]|uniref:ubiquitin carboxyl-terminal hydrolase 28-like n=1 Tax=Sturnira hondurensis TaxID=192404 RepID=UPI00187AFE48|nr:ubiquitin carboxyl-terminal hydrolase 28-like [Sturnira hondurensis]
MEPMLVVFICSQFAWGIIAFVLVGLYFRAVKNCHISRFGGSPLGQILGELIFYCNDVWPMYVLDCGEKWPANGSLNYCTIMQLNLYCQKLGKWDEIPYVRAFISLHNKVSSRAGDRLLLQRKEEASKLLSDHKAKESFSVRNPEERRSVGGRPLPWCPVRLGWRLSTTVAELQEDDMAGAAADHDSSCQMEVDQQREDQDLRAPPLLGEGLKARNGDVPLAGTLTSGRVKEPDPDTVGTEPPEETGSAANKKAFARVLGLARKSKDELDAAVALSLLNSPKCHTGRKTLRRHDTVSVEMKHSKKRHFDVWGENRNPSDWKRVDGWPVGLKNVGNTCWFSAVIQSLFQLPEFRRVVLSSTVPQNALENCTDEREKRNVMFMQELQRLFALMMGSNRKFVDPSSALNLLKGAFQSVEEEEQQDVSEFTHKLLDWLEDAFQLTVVADSNLENPMVRLFYGTVLTEGVREGKLFTNTETFGLYPLQVNGYCNLQECLDGAMVEGDIELLLSNQSVENGQEYWFTKLPPVLSFELSRFEFNQSLGQPEKIHNKLEFPQVIYMDKYMHRNKDLVQSKRQCVRRLKEEIVLLQQKMEKHVKYDLDPAQSPLLDVTSQSDSRVTVPLSLVTGEGRSSPSIASIFSEDRLCTSTTKNEPFPSSQSSGEMPAQPDLQTVVTDEINLKTYLQKRSSETEQDVQDLKNVITSTTRAIQQMYCDPLLSQVPYRLHAVLVHEGQADAGHYWVYIYNQPRQVWLKYNDISVTESSWEELERDSYGGSRNASAYCLMYIKDQPPDFNADATPSESEQMLGELEALSDELKHYIREDNWKFEQEIEEWEEEQSRKISQMELSASPAPLDSPTSQKPSGAPSGVHSLSSQHGVMVKEQISQATANPTCAYGKSGVGTVWNEALHEKYSRLY